MLRSPRFLALAVIAVLAGLGLLLLTQVGGSGVAVPGALLDVPEEEPVTQVDPEAIVTGDPIAELAVSGLEVEIEVDVRARILPPEAEPILGARARAAVSRVEPLTPAGGPSLVEVELTTGEILYRVLDLNRSLDFERVEVELRGRVVDEASNPIAGAVVWYGQSGPEVVFTDEDGRFHVPSMLGGPGVPVVVECPDYVSRYTVMHLDGSVYVEPLFVLEPGVMLRLQVAGDVPAPERARVFLAPEGTGDTRLQQFPFFLPVIQDRWRIWDESGARILGLPVGAQVKVTVAHPLAVTPPAQSVRLREGSRVVVPLRGLPVLTGRVVDGEGQPVGRALVVSGREDQALASRRLHPRLVLPREVGLNGATPVLTDWDGSFTVAAGEMLRITAAGYAGLEMPVEGDDRLEIRLFEHEPGEPTLRVRVPGCDGSYRVRCRPFRNGLHSVLCGEAFEQVLPQASLVDVRIQIRANGVLMEPQTFSGLPVQGLTELDLR